MGKSSREIAYTRSPVVTRLVRNCALGRATKYSRDANDRTDKPRRTGSSACAEDDSGGCLAISAVIASAATQSIYPRAETRTASYSRDPPARHDADRPRAATRDQDA